MALPRARIVKDSDPVFQSCQVWHSEGADDSCDHQMKKSGVDTLVMSPYFYDDAFLPSILNPGK